MNLLTDSASNGLEQYTKLITNFWMAKQK